jgi:lipid-A-disaccharide synthase
MKNTQPHIVLVAGEASGDNLGAALIEALRERLPHARFSGVAGPKMRAAGCVPWERSESLAVMGLLEVLPELPRLFRIRRNLIARVRAEQPAVYVGVDFKEFNLSVARKLKRTGIRTIQYVSPQVWAWRQGRVRKIANAVDAVLCLLPFEKDFYDQHAPADTVDARFVGHPLADHIPMTIDRGAVRATLDLARDVQCVALLPGSRRGEVKRLAPDFARTIASLHTERPAMRFVAAMANDEVKKIFAVALKAEGVAEFVRLVDGRSQDVLAAGDVALLASGTATLEATLVKRPMVVVYRADWLMSLIFRLFGLMKAPFFSLPNLLAGRQIVPEFLNEEVRCETLGPALIAQLERSDRAELIATFTEIHRVLRREASRRAAEAVVDLISSKG